MRYISTRGDAPALPFDDVLLTGLARDGGLYVPETWPTLTTDDFRSFKDLSYAELAHRIVKPFVGDRVPDADLADICDRAYRGFGEDVAPLTDLGGGMHMLELFHGPTLAFKDHAMQFLGLAFDHVLSRRGRSIAIVGATSGDTGSAAIAACRDRDSIEIFILHPHGRVSDVQRRQMTTVAAANVHNIALEGSFDDAQDAVKAMFGDLDFRDAHRLGAVNSINWARIMAQIVYYVWAAVKLDATDRELDFAVPTGNFGNIFAGYGAKRMGLPIRKLIVGTNRNDVLPRFLDSGRMEKIGVSATISPSMDIQIPSNFERFLFDLMDRDGAAVAETMRKFHDGGHFGIAADRLERARRIFVGHRLDDDETMAVIGDIRRQSGVLVDPHGAIGIGAARAEGVTDGTPMVVLATAHPAKFPAAVEKATGERPSLPTRMADLFERKEHMDVLPNDLDELKTFVADWVAKRRAA